MTVNSILPIYRLYQSLPLGADEGLGGKLLYAGEMNEAAGHLLYAANIAGAASLAASADPNTLRQAMRDGVVDFVVNSLEEALRILKNEIRKRQTVSVGVACAPGKLTEQMLDRGVLPDLLPGDALLNSEALHPEQLGQFLEQGARQITEPVSTNASRFITWQVDRDFTRRLPPLDELAKAVLPAEDHPRQRWLRLAPRYLGRLAQRQHGVPMTEAEFISFAERTALEIAELPPPTLEKNEF